MTIRKAERVPLNFLLGCSDGELGSFQLSRLANVANLRKDLHQILDEILEQQLQAALAVWFKQQDRATLRQTLEDHVDPGEWAKARIRDGQRSEQELVPETFLPPGDAHRAASLRYQRANVAEGLCSVCPQPLDRNSVKYCTLHLEKARGRNKLKGGHGRQPGTLKALAEAREKRTKPKGDE